MSQETRNAPSDFLELDQNIFENEASHFESGDLLNDFFRSIGGVSLDEPLKDKFEIIKREKKESSDYGFRKNNDYRSFTGLEIRISKDFSYLDLPNFVLQLKKDLPEESEIIDVLKSISMRYKRESLMLNGLLENPNLELSENLNANQKRFIKGVRKNLSKKAFFYFQLSQVFNPNRTEKLDLKDTKEISRAYSLFLENNNHQIATEESSAFLQKIEELRTIINEEQGFFTIEFLEAYALDKDNFTFQDQEKLIIALRKEIISNQNFNPRNQEILLAEVSLWQSQTSVKKISNVKDFLSHFHNLLKSLDKIIMNFNIQQFQNMADSELYIHERKFANDLRIQLQKDFESLIFANGFELMNRESGITQIFDNNFVEYFEEKFRSDIEKIKSLREKYFSLKLQIKKEPNNQKNQSELADLQMDIAKGFFAILESQDFFKLKNEGKTYAISELAQKEESKYKANCMLIATVYKALWKEYFGEDVKAVSTNNHFFTVLKNAKGEMIAMDLYTPTIINIKMEKDIQDATDLLAGKSFVIVGESFDENYNASVWNWIGHDAFDKGNLQKAEIAYKKATQKMPENPDFLRDLADLYTAKSAFKEAEKYYEQSLALDQNNETTLYQFASMYYEMRNYQEAYELFKKITEINPNNYEAQNATGFLALKCFESNANKNFLNIAKEHLLKALMLRMNEDNMPITNLALVLKKQGESEKAHALLAENGISVDILQRA